MLFLRAFHLKCTLTYLNISDRLCEEIDCSCYEERSRKTKSTGEVGNPIESVHSAHTCDFDQEWSCEKFHTLAAP